MRPSVQRDDAGVVDHLDEDGDVVVLRAGRELERLAEMNLGSPVYGAPIAANGVLYINTISALFALEEQGRP